MPNSETTSAIEELRLAIANDRVQQEEVIRTNMRRIQAEDEAKRASEAHTQAVLEHTRKVDQLYKRLEYITSYIETGRLEEFLKFLEGRQSFIGHAMETLVLVVTNRSDIKAEDLIDLVRSGLMRADAPTAPNFSNGREAKRRSNTAPLRLFDEAKLIDALLECNAIKNDFNTIKSDLPAEVANRIVGESLRVQVREMVRACVQFNCISKMIDVVHFYEGDSLAMRHVEEVV